MRIIALILGLMLLLAAPAMATHHGEAMQEMFVASNNSGKKSVIIIKGKGGKVTKVKKPKPKHKK